MEEEFAKFKRLNPDLANDLITVKDHAFYLNLIQGNNMKVSGLYAQQTKYIDKDKSWTEGNFFMLLIILEYIEYCCAQPYGAEGDKLEAARKANKSAHRIIGTKTDRTNNDVKMDTMSDLSCVPAIILLKGAFDHYKLQPVYFHPEKAKDALVA